MFAKFCSSFQVAACALIAVTMVSFNAVYAQDASAPTGITVDQLKALLPDPQDLPGFLPTRPISIWPNANPGEMAPDGIKLNAIHHMPDGRIIPFSLAARHWYSLNEMYSVDMRVRIYTSPTTAHDVIIDDFSNIQAAYKPGAFSGSVIGDECWFYYGPSPGSRLVFRYGKVVVSVGGAMTFPALKEGGAKPFPASSVEAIANMILMRLARHPELTGVPTQAARVAVNGQAMPARSALLIGKKLFVPVTQFAKAAGHREPPSIIQRRKSMFVASLKASHLLRIGACAALAFSAMLPIQAQSQVAPVIPAITADQLKALLPNEQDLQGFVPVMPAFDTGDRNKARPLDDGIGLNTLIKGFGGQTVTASGIARTLYSQSAMYRLSMSVNLYDSAETAHSEIANFQSQVQAMYRPGMYSGSPIGDECWFCYDRGDGGAILVRQGKAMMIVDGTLTSQARKQGKAEPFPMSSVEAIANTILMRLARHPELTGVPAQAARVAVNGQAMPARSALLIGKQLYVPVTEFAKAAGWTSRWNATTGALTLTNPNNKQPITLAAGSTAISEKGKARPVSLKSAVLKEANQPVMLLDDLLTLTKGRIAERKGDTFRITV